MIREFFVRAEKYDQDHLAYSLFLKTGGLAPWVKLQKKIFKTSKTEFGLNKVSVFLLSPIIFMVLFLGALFWKRKNQSQCINCLFEMFITSLGYY